MYVTAWKGTLNCCDFPIAEAKKMAVLKGAYTTVSLARTIYLHFESNGREFLHH